VEPNGGFGFWVLGLGLVLLRQSLWTFFKGKINKNIWVNVYFYYLFKTFRRLRVPPFSSGGFSVRGDGLCGTDLAEEDP